MLALSLLAILYLAGVIALAVRWTPGGLRGKPLISCYMLVIGLFGIYYFIPGALLLFLTRGRYVWVQSFGGYGSVAITAFVAGTALLLFLAGYALRNRGSNSPPSVFIPAEHESFATGMAWAVVAIGVMLKLYVILGSGGLAMTILRESTGVRESLRLLDVDPLLTRLWFLSGIADAGACWLLIREMQKGRSFWLFMALFLVVTVITFIGTGKRLYALWPLLTIFLAIHYYVRPIRISLLPIGVAAVLGLGLSSLLFRIYAPASLANVNIDLFNVAWAEGSVLRFYFLSLEFASFELLTLAIDSPASVVNQFGGAWDAFVTTNLTPFSYFVPRELWPSKPDVLFDLSHANRVAMFGGTLDNGAGVASMLPGTSWVIAGPLGLTVAMLVLGWMSAAADRMASVRGTPSLRALVVYAFLITVLFHLFRQGTLAWTAIIVLVQQAGLIVGYAMIFTVEARGKKFTLNQVARRDAPRKVADAMD